MEESYYHALGACLDRYRKMIADHRASHDHTVHQDLLDFIEEFDLAITKRYPLCKLNRWLGYIQGVLIERHVTTVTAERDWTRPLFRPIDFIPAYNSRLIKWEQRLALAAMITIGITFVAILYIATGP